MATAAASIGHNNPPPLEAFRLHIEELMETAQGFLDGEPIATEAQAEDIAKLREALKQARKDADAQRSIEKKPHDEAAKAVQSAWKPLIDRTELGETVCKKALAPWLEAREAESRAAALEARRIADEAASAARAAQQAGATDLAGREAAEQAIKDAEFAQKAARQAEKAKPMVAGGGRSVSLRSVWTPVLADPVAALKHYRSAQPEALKDWLLGQAQADVRAGKRQIPGFTITETKVAQ